MIIAAMATAFALCTACAPLMHWRRTLYLGTICRVSLMTALSRRPLQDVRHSINWRGWKVPMEYCDLPSSRLLRMERFSLVCERSSSRT